MLPKDPSQNTLADIDILIGRVGQLALTLTAAIAVIYIIIGAYSYFTAFGNEEKAQNAKKTVTWAIIGLVVIILAKVIISEIWKFVTNEPLNFLF